MEFFESTFPAISYRSKEWNNMWKEFSLKKYMHTSPKLRIRNWKHFYYSQEKFAGQRARILRQNTDEIHIENCGLLFDEIDENNKEGLGKYWTYVCTQRIDQLTCKDSDNKDTLKCKKCSRKIHQSDKPLKLKN
eukprot:UN32918